MTYQQFNNREQDRVAHEANLEALSSFYDKEYQDHVRKTKSNLPQQSDESNFDRLLTDRDALDKKQFLYRTGSKLMDQNTGNVFNLEDVYQSNRKRESAFLQNQMNSRVQYLKQFELMFFTLTEPSHIHKQFDKTSYAGKMTTIVKSKEKYNDFMRTYLKNRLFKTLDKTKRFYVRATEMHKSFMLHEHCSFFTPSNHIMQSFNLLYKTWENKDLGRLEVVLDSKFKKEFFNNKKWFATKLKNKITGKIDNVFIKRSDLHLRKTGRFFYVKFLEESCHGDQKLQMLKYVMKYVLKNSYLNDDKMDKRSYQERSIYLKLNIRPISYSQFLFPKYLYYNLVENTAGIPIYELFSLKELTDLNHSGRIKIHYKNELLTMGGKIKDFYKIKFSDLESEEGFSDFENDLVEFFMDRDGIDGYYNTRLMFYNKNLGEIESMGYNLSFSSIFQKYIDFVQLKPISKNGIKSFGSIYFELKKTNCIFL